MTETPLKQLREKITSIDEEIIDLIARRRDVVTQIVQTKINANLPIRDAAREKILVDGLIQKGKQHHIDESIISRLYQIIIEDSVFLQTTLLQKNTKRETEFKPKIAFLGPKGSYSHSAARRYGGAHFSEIEELGCASFNAVFEQVENGFVDYGIVPIENTSSGSINEIYDLLQKTNLHLIGEIILPIEHCILATTQSQLANIDTIYSHPQPFQQCSNFFNTPSRWNIIYCDSSSSAMEKVAQLNQPNIAAIGNKDGGQLYGLHIIEENLANQKENITRFIILARKPIIVSETTPAKTTILMKTGQQAGALVDALLILRHYNIAMIKLESRPIHGNPWEEMFYIDLQGNIDSFHLQRALKELSAMALFLKVLGCYPTSSITGLI